MGLTSDPSDPRLGRGSDERPEGQNQVYLVLSEAERGKGFVAPLRFSYVHVGERRNTVGEPSGRACNSLTSMNKAIAETYARNPSFYGATFCVACQMHLPVGAEDSGGEFVWANDAGIAEQPHWYVGTLPPEEPVRDDAAAIAACPTPEYHETHRYCPSCPWKEPLPAGFGEPPVPDPPDESPELREARESIWTPERESPGGETKLWTPEVIVGGGEPESRELRKVYAMLERITVAVSGDGPLESQVRRWWTLVAVSGVVGALAGLGIGLWLA